MIRADLLVTDIGELATLATGRIPRVGRDAQELGILHGAAVAVADGRFVWVGRERDLSRSVRLRTGGRRVSAKGGAVVPGFVDAHTHVLFGGDRAFELPLRARGMGYAEIARAGGGLYASVRATRNASDATLLAATAARLTRMGAWGSTSVEVKSGYALTTAGELRLLRLIPRLARATGLRLVPTFLGAHAVAPEYRSRPDAYVDRLIHDALPQVARERLARFCDVFCEPGFFSVRQSERLLRAALALGLGVKVHAEEFVLSGGARLAARLHAVSAEHLLAARAEDRALLAKSGVTAVLLPVTALAAAPGVRSPGREMVDAGVPVALGTDCSPNSWVEAMPLVLAHAVHAARLSPAEALTAATVNAAHASGLEDAGTIATGRPADFVVFPVRSVDQLGYRFDVIPAVVFRQGNRISPPTLRQYF
ncbi:MAG TPA: imidazolonepropionase [Thermoplasmata archaeon]|nr:imidazolonepropionase [Thermoplasmata archaeon]